MPTQRKTIAVLIDHIDQLSHGYESQLRWGFMRACSDLDINLLIVAGRALRAPEPWGAPRNGVYELLHANCVDGLILMSNGIIGGCSIEELQAICRGYSPLPLCSAGLAIPGVPSVVIDNRPGMAR
jgi:DNA-binding LacI/PurR family transcriptional regulator